MREAILLTGATGALGGELLKRLILRGESVVCLSRARGEETPRERIERTTGRNEKVEVLSGDICEPWCGVSPEARAHFRGRVAKVIHCAASISFWDRAEAEATNIRGVENVLALAEALGAREFHHISTAYVCGAAAEFAEGDIPQNGTHRPRNVYEETKQKGEALVRLWANIEKGRCFSIYRPSILIGRQNGTTPTFDAYYGWFRPIHSIAEAMRAKCRAGEELPVDVRVSNRGIVDMPLVLSAGREATLNLVPIDWVADMLAELIFAPPSDAVYHLVNPFPPLVRWVIAASLAHLKIGVGDAARIKVVESGSEKAEALARQSPLVSRLQRQLALVLDQYYPYTSVGPQFAAERAKAVLGERFRSFRTIDAAFLGELLGYALSENWGIPRDNRGAKTAASV
ncbi:MAG: SDR family oxidoreductase [Parcubacteria group bacterium]|nr:SDR family oxidoreductase [Parcubacteria group bacterium]MBI2049132.1 SDR family oxidoreductase [Parcubacteria group bacterium]